MLLSNNLGEKKLSTENIIESHDKAFKIGNYKAYSLHNLEKIPQLQEFCSDEQIHAMKVVGNVLPFKTNNYVVEQLINWNNPNDPIYILNFPQKEMLKTEHFKKMESVLEKTTDFLEIKQTADSIRKELNPQPAGQKAYNVPMVNGLPLEGAQHKYRETLLFFPSQGQTCHAYCSFCFRWPQFVGDKNLRFANKQAEQLVQYVQEHSEIQDVLFTGGDPMVMKTKILSQYIKPLIDADIKHLQTIRIGTKSLSYWPYRFTEDNDSENLIDLFKEVEDNNLNLAIMAHFNHPRELVTGALKDAVKQIKSTGAQIRTQSPILKHINDKAKNWAIMWRKQVDLGMIPYYMFVVRDTGAKHYFEIPLLRAWEIFHEAYQKVSGICRTVRGPSMSSLPGKIQILGPAELENKKIMVFRFIQGRNPDWTTRPFFAQYDPKASWLDDLKPLSGDKFFFEEELKQLQHNSDFWFKNDSGLDNKDIKDNEIVLTE